MISRSPPLPPANSTSPRRPYIPKVPLVTVDSGRFVFCWSAAIEGILFSSRCGGAIRIPLISGSKEISLHIIVNEILIDTKISETWHWFVDNGEINSECRWEPLVNYLVTYLFTPGVARTNAGIFLQRLELWTRTGYNRVAMKRMASNGFHRNLGRFLQGENMYFEHCSCKRNIHFSFCFLFCPRRNLFRT